MSVANFVRNIWTVESISMSHLSGEAFYFLFIRVSKPSCKWEIKATFFKIPCSPLRTHMTMFTNI